MSKLLKEQFLTPDSEFSPMPFWFWNDDLSKEELKKQLHDFKSKGVMGFVLHPRMGIPENISYLSDEFMEYVNFTVEEAKHLGMYVILYDEAMYPSGAANGKVVEKNPQFASRGLKADELTISEALSPFTLHQYDRLMAIYFAKKTSGKIDSENVSCVYPLNIATVQQLDTDKDKQSLQIDPNIIERFFQSNERIEEEWVTLLVYETETGGTIRGIHTNQDDGEKNAPRSADLLNKEAVDTFIQITHDRYKEVVGEHFGDTIFAMFTDEPDMLGRNARKGLIPWTKGFENEFFAKGNHVEDIVGLFYDVGDRTYSIRKSYQSALHQRLLANYYQPISKWCEQNGLALTGHPAASDDIGLLEPFHIPGQDVVWRWVAPEDQKAIEGEHSTAGKCGADAARHLGRRRNINEFLGVCGIDNNWNLSAGDMKWYIDWLAVRGVNLFCPHAFYYSVEGKQRSHERPPDVGQNNTWWPYYRYFSQYMMRLSWVMTDSVNQAKVAVLAEDSFLPWQMAKMLYQNQIEFNYLNSKHLINGDVTFEQGTLNIQKQQYQLLIIDQISLESIHPSIIEQLKLWIEQGGKVLVNGNNKQKKLLPEADYIPDYIKKLDELDQNDQSFLLNYQSVQLAKESEDIRVSVVEKSDLYFYLIVNEGESTYNDSLTLPHKGNIEIWDPWKGQFDNGNANGSSIELELPRRSSILLVVDPANTSLEGNVNKDLYTCCIQQLEYKPNVRVQCDHKVWSKETLTSWTEINELCHYSGTISYPFVFELDHNPEDYDQIQLDLGAVYDIAEVKLNQQLIDVIFWSPYKLSLPKRVFQKGDNVLEINVTNNMANQMDHLELPSGLLGPITLTYRKQN
ncbi:glycosyl hydrolase [Gracilibacillus sp. YIM 98692]|uniref:glycosyl hydrolase n=1 Tax=Gracilibacillus sp. YIM 98692 TaxID=2663532 RepID=UPI0013D0F590|nr:glycosyl hydrolase [Gracilibacillus sp. YIM 98692]